MPLYSYKVLTPENTYLEGQIQADSEHAVINKLQNMGYFPISTSVIDSNTSQKSVWFLNEKVSQKDVLILTQKLSITMKAGLSLDDALALQIETADSPAVKSMLEKVTLSIHNGATLSEAFSEYNVFDRFYLNTLHAGENTGKLDLVLGRLALHLKHAQQVKKQIITALTYPIVLMVVAVLTLWILLIYVVPQFQALFDDMGQTLPLPTQIVISIANITKNYGWVLIIALSFFIFSIKTLLKSQSHRRHIDNIILATPLISNIIIKREVGRFCRTLGTLLANGVPILKALNIISGSINNTIISKIVEETKDDVQKGHRLAESLSKSSIFPQVALHLIKVGEQTGELTTMLEQVTEIYDQELSDDLSRFLTLLEPLLIIGLGVIIAAIIISVLLAILALNEFAI
jgi:general secretion pathway protein F